MLIFYVVLDGFPSHFGVVMVQKGCRHLPSDPLNDRPAARCVPPVNGRRSCPQSGGGLGLLLERPFQGGSNSVGPSPTHLMRSWVTVKVTASC